MKYKYYILILILATLYACGDKDTKVVSAKTQTQKEYHEQIHDNLDKASEELNWFDNLLITLYKECEINPQRVIFKTDSILNSMSKESDSLHLGVKSNKIGYLHYLRGEIFYKIKQYKKSINEFKNETGQYNEFPLACNYVKLKDFNVAKLYIDSINNLYYISDYVIGNFQEALGKKEEALTIYNKIKNDKSIKHYAYYELAINRIKELEKKNPILLDELYFPTGRPDFEICDDDSENRNRIFDTISTIKEVIECNTCGSTLIYESPQENDKNYYWVKVGPGGGDKAIFNFFIYVNTFEVKYYDAKNNKLYSLEEWRKMK